MKCPICGADNDFGAKVCASCGSNLNTRGGADIVMRDDGSADHAGESRWKSGAGLAGAGGLAALLKTGLIFKLWTIFALVRLAHLAFLGGSGIIIAIVGIVFIIGGAIFRYRRKLHL
jgi:hypothetical protein